MSIKILKTTTYNWFKLREDFQSHFKVFSYYFRERVHWKDFLIYLWRPSVFHQSIKGSLFILRLLTFTGTHTRPLLKGHQCECCPSELPSSSSALPLSYQLGMLDCPMKWYLTLNLTLPSEDRGRPWLVLFIIKLRFGVAWFWLSIFS